MNSVLLHDPDQASSRNGRYAAGLSGVYQTLHDRLIEALQKWVPPEETHTSTEPAVRTFSPQCEQSLVHYENLTKATSPPAPPPPSIFLPTVTNAGECGVIDTGGLHVDLTNLHRLLAKSTRLSSPSVVVTQPAQPQSNLTTISGNPKLTDSSKLHPSSNDSSALNVGVSEHHQPFRQTNFYSPLSVCTAGPQYEINEPISTRLPNLVVQSKLTKDELMAPHKDCVDSDFQLNSNFNSSNLLHQLLSGADVTQVRNRSGLLEPSLCGKQILDSKLTKLPHEPQGLTPNKSHLENAPGDTEPFVNQNVIPFTTNTIPVSNLQIVHSPKDTTTMISANHSTLVSEQTSLIHQSLSGVVSSLAPAVSNDSTLLVEKLLYLLIELQKSQASAKPREVSTSVSPRVNTSPCSIPMECPGTPSSLNSPAYGLATMLPTSSSTPTPTATPDTTNSAHCLRQLLTASSSNSELSNRLSVRWQSPQLLSPLQASIHQQPVVWPLLRPGAMNNANSTTATPAASTPTPTEIYEPRPRSKSDIPSTTRRRLRISRNFRPRNHTKLERADSGPSGGPFGAHFAESESESTCELESSLFAQLILSPDSPASSNSHPTESVKNFCHDDKNQEDVRNSSGPHSTISSRDSIRSPHKATTMNITPIVAAKSGTKVDESPSSPSSSFTCHSGSRTQVFEWLRESDLFVAEHCFDIPLGALLATAISPGRSQWAELCCSALFTSNPPADPVPGLTRHVVNKLWHQLLLVSLIENNFKPQCVTTAGPSCGGQTDPSDSVAPAPLSMFVCHTRSDPYQHHHTAQPLRDKVLNAISSLAALDIEETPAPDAHLVSELNRLVTEGTRLQLTPGLFRLIRYCILAQNAYPYHFSTTYSEALSELETELTGTPGAPALTDVLKLLNHLHCFDAGTLKQFFGLSSDPITAASALHHSSPSGSTLNSGAAFDVNQHHQNQISGFGFGNFKRKANGIDDLLHLHPDRSTERDLSPVQLRSRAYTTTECSKSARLSTTMPDVASDAPGVISSMASLGRPRSDTVPRTGRHPRRAERSWRFGIR
ncbi:hypothetical protein FGIG_06908 [Fasciola gigantica]|uniref:Uncharacterized protein n=1 Tax=Fasciola gigantica TaxID=46835 RepID=A0A504Y8T6_FASGI|nr:hypothetical protein FGIG_06908 [Fasciola gigantica]